MDWTEEVREKIKRKNKILFSRESSCLQDLLELIMLQKHRTLVLWAFACAEEAVGDLARRYPQEERLTEALAQAKRWAQGEIKMSAARRYILQAHAAAKDMKDPADEALCHSIGQACAVVHTETHAIGFPIYELTALVRRQGLEEGVTAVEERIAWYMEVLKACASLVETGKDDGKWAEFLLNDEKPNKERERYLKKIVNFTKNLAFFVRD